MIRKTLTILSLIGLLLSVGLWGVSYSWLTIYWGENRVALSAGRLLWLSDFDGNPSGSFRWQCTGFHGSYFERLKP